MANRTPRESTTRERSERSMEWRPGSALEAPEAPLGYKHRWIRAEARGFSDTKNVSARLREGYELVRADEYPDSQFPVIEDGKYSGVIGVGGLLLARIPEELVKQRQEYYANQHNEKVKAMDNDLMKEEHPSMPIDIDRQTRVTFGGSKKS